MPTNGYAAEQFLKNTHLCSKDDAQTILVGVAIALHVNYDTLEAYPSKAAIARLTHCSEKTVQRHTKKLIEAGDLECDQQAGPGRGDRRTNVYRFPYLEKQDGMPTGVSPHMQRGDSGDTPADPRSNRRDGNNRENKVYRPSTYSGDQSSDPPVTPRPEDIPYTVREGWVFDPIGNRWKHDGTSWEPPLRQGVPPPPASYDDPAYNSFSGQEGPVTDER